MVEWDHDDFISYAAAPIIEGVDDESYGSGVSLLKAPGKYLTKKKGPIPHRSAPGPQPIFW
jgi:hypothetical protein